jgi:hypothetical protein
MTAADHETRRRRVLIVSLHFPPINTPDMQRTRMALPYLRSFGWEPVVLAISPDLVEGGVREPLLEKSYPDDIEIVRVRGVPPWATRWAGVGSLWLRCGRAIRKAGDRLLATGNFDLVFFSTTQFDAFSSVHAGSENMAFPTCSITRIPGSTTIMAEPRRNPRAGG